MPWINAKGFGEGEYTQEQLDAAKALHLELGKFFGRNEVLAEFRAATGEIEVTGYDGQVFIGIDGIDINDSPVDVIEKTWYSGYIEGFRYGAGSE